MQTLYDWKFKSQWSMIDDYAWMHDEVQSKFADPNGVPKLSTKVSYTQSSEKDGIDRETLVDAQRQTGRFSTQISY